MKRRPCQQIAIPRRTADSYIYNTFSIGHRFYLQASRRLCETRHKINRRILQVFKFRREYCVYSSSGTGQCPNKKQDTRRVSPSLRIIRISLGFDSDDLSHVKYAVHFQRSQSFCIGRQLSFSDTVTFLLNQYKFIRSFKQFRKGRS
jgi:hypothetical protein